MAHEAALYCTCMLLLMHNYKQTFLPISLDKMALLYLEKSISLAFFILYSYLMVCDLMFISGFKKYIE